MLSTGSWGLSEKELPGKERASCQLLRLQLSDDPRVFAHRLEFDSLFWLRGEVTQGHFRLSEPGSHNDGLKIEVPREFEAPSSTPIERRSGLPKELDDFVTVYRKALSGFGGDWDLRPIGTAQGGGAKQPVAAKLDDMYLPLRFHEKFDPRTTDAGQTLHSESLLARRVVRNRDVRLDLPDGSYDDERWLQLRSRLRSRVSNC